MSSSTSTSSPKSQTTPLHERSNSEQNRQNIRLVPYSPPRPEAEADSSQGSEAEAGSDDDHQTAGESAGVNWARNRTPPTKENHAFDPEFEVSSPSPSPSPAPIAWIKANRVSGSKLAPGLSGSESRAESPTPPTPVLNRAPYAPNSRRLSAPARPSWNVDRTASPTLRRPPSRRSTIINVNPDGTFSLSLKPARRSDRTEPSLTPPPVSNISTATSRERISFGAPSTDLPSSPPSSVPERSVSPCNPSPPSFAAEPEGETTFPTWNYRMVGGLRQIPKTPDSKKRKGKEKATENVVASSSLLPPLPETSAASAKASGLVAKPSFHSHRSNSTNTTIEETVNYKVVGRSSPALTDSGNLEVSLPSSSNSNYRVIAESSPAHHLISSPAAGFLDTPGSKNVVVHADTPSSLATLPRRPRPQYSNDSLSEQIRERYSQESLVIPPLNPRKKPPPEKFGHFKKFSRESLRSRANSLSSISSIISQDTASLFLSSTPNLTRMEPHPHQWSSQLSTVMSEYEGSDRDSRLASAISRSDRGSSALGSRHSRQLLSISSSLTTQEEALGSPRPRSDPLERPSPAYMRGALPSPPTRTVRDLDEHGDGIADLQQHQLQHKPSWSRVGAYLSRRGSDRELHSSASSRAGSFTAASIPTWARLYYGSGERRWLATAASIQSLSEAAASRPGSSFRSGSPADDHLPQSVFNPRRRPRELPAHADPPASADVAFGGVAEMRLGAKKKTSSIWSPHLRFDRRAIRFSVWQPPSATWPAEGGFLGRGNVQVLLFVVGFGIPLAWMVAAFLPLPPKPVMETSGPDDSATGLGIAGEQGVESFDQRIAPIDEARYHNSRWWRNLNRIMSIIGLLILGTIATLAVPLPRTMSSEQSWTDAEPSYTSFSFLTNF
ncbi:hypothetical protein DL768_007726 [Monosporascus sp. mg162]|nr:hypothetical protein DL768_007726 [Monosporascus sp. mg162]